MTIPLWMAIGGALCAFLVGWIACACVCAGERCDDFAESVYRERFRQTMSPQAFVDMDAKCETLPIARKLQRRDRELAAARLTWNLDGGD